MSVRPAPHGSIRHAAGAAYRGDLPERYEGSQRDAFDLRVRALLRPGTRVLDVGAGRRPTFGREERPPGCEYVGLDLVAAELEAAPPGSYDEVHVGDVVDHLPELDGRFDLAVSWQVLEHVRPLDDAIENVRRCLVPGGRFVAQFSGTFSVFGVLNRALGHQASRWLLQRLQGRAPESVFPAHYHHCWATALERMGERWSRFEVVPRYLGADYLSFSRVLRAAYISYEEWLARGDRGNLAGYYLVDATR